MSRWRGHLEEILGSAGTRSGKLHEVPWEAVRRSACSFEPYFYVILQAPLQLLHGRLHFAHAVDREEVPLGEEDEYDGGFVDVFFEVADVLKIWSQAAKRSHRHSSATVG